MFSVTYTMFRGNATLLSPRHRSLGFSNECFNLHFGAIHFADLGDGEGRKPEQFLARQEYFPVLGTCWETIAGKSLLSQLLFVMFGLS